MAGALSNLTRAEARHSQVPFFHWCVRVHCAATAPVVDLRSPPQGRFQLCDLGTGARCAVSPAERSGRAPHAHRAIAFASGENSHVPTGVASGLEPGWSACECGRVRSRHPARTSVAGSVLCLLLGFCHVLCRPQAYRATSDSLLKFSLATRRHPPDITSDARERRDCDRGVHVYESEAVCR
jgi:hypothetical protein